jgi:hypothetical protein
MKKLVLFFVLIAGSFQLLFCQEVSSLQFKNRIGLNVGGSSGFTNIPIGELQNGKKVSITFGGGTVVKFEYSHEFTRHFDISVDAGGQFSTLDKDIDNGSMSFNRSNLSLTPSYILLIGNEDNMRLRFGAGIDLFYNSELNFDLSKVPGGAKDDWKYNVAVGEHVSITFERNISKRYSISAGVKVHNSDYSFKSGNNSHPTDKDLKNPNGSGIDFFLGAYYHFNWRK